MKTPICTFDAKTAVLCTKCETKLRSGRLTHADIEGAIKITKLAERNQDISKFTMTSASKVDDDFIIALSGAGTIRSNPTLLMKFEDEFHSKVWFVEAQATDKRFIENLFFPIKILAVNMIWLPDGGKLTKVIISSLDKIELLQQHPNIEKVKQIAKKIRNIELLVEFESPN